MKKYRAIIVEDERLPRLSLIRKLETYHPDIEIVDCCESYETALTAILRHRPDILFLDIQLQGHTTLELLRELKEAMPLYFRFNRQQNNCLTSSSPLPTTTRSTCFKPFAWLPPTTC